MAGRNVTTISDCTNEKNKGKEEECVAGQQTISQSFQVQNYRDYDVYSDVENVINLNPVSYIDYVNPTHSEADAKATDIKEIQERPTASLITNIGKTQPALVSTSMKIGAHIIGPSPPPSKPVSTRQKHQRRDDSDNNYFETVALNEEVIQMCCKKESKKDNPGLVSKIYLLELLLICFQLLIFMLY